MQVLTVGVLLADVDFFGFVVLHVLSNGIFVVVLDLAGNVCSCCVKAGLLVFLQLGAITVNTIQVCLFIKA
jgi:hypothetical protein